VPNLFRDVRTGVIIYRKQEAGLLRRISTGETSVEAAVAWKRQHEEEQRSQRSGAAGDPWLQPLAPLARRWTSELECCEDRRNMLERQITTALEMLELAIARDLRDRPAIKQRLKALELRRKTAQGAFQQPLKQFSSWLAAEDLLPEDPLSPWKRIDTSREPKRARRGFEAEEVALALAASAWFDSVRGVNRPARPIYLALLVAGPRVGAFIDLEVAAFDRTEQRLVLGDDQGNKLRGRATLDATTAAEIDRYVGDRKSGPLFLSPEGKALRQEKVLRAWRECMDLALVIDLWPEDRPKKLERAWAVARWLTRQRVPTGGGNPARLSRETRKARHDREVEIAALAEGIAPRFRERRAGVDVHAFRKTHQSWAEAQEDPIVLPAAIDKQIGHSNRGGEALQHFFQSRVGRQHYRDLGLSLFDPRRSAEAVRATLDRAEASLRTGDYRGWTGLAEAAPAEGAGGAVVIKTVIMNRSEPAVPEVEGPEVLRLPALRSLEMTGLEPVAYTLRRPDRLSPMVARGVPKRLACNGLWLARCPALTHSDPRSTGRVAPEMAPGEVRWPFAAPSVLTSIHAAAREHCALWILHLRDQAENLGVQTQLPDQQTHRLDADSLLPARDMQRVEARRRSIPLG
jgi:hypothetical protein